MDTGGDGLCLQDLLDSMEEVKKTTSKSRSIFVYGRLKPDVLPEIPASDVVLKLALPSQPLDNSLEVERKIYMRIRKELIVLTPHLLPGFYAGSCNDTAILQYANSTDPISKSLYLRWATLRAPTAFLLYPKQVREEMRKEVIKEKGGLFTFDKWVEVYEDIAFPPTTIEFVMTPKMTGMRLDDALARGGPQFFSEIQLLSIAVQMAQAISVLESKQINHHDLHLGNIFFQPLRRTDKMSYSFPFPFEILVDFSLLIYDFDHASNPGFVENNTLTRHYCMGFGECDTFVPNFDWYGFLMQFLDVLTALGFPVPSALSNIMIDNVEGVQDVHLGHPCTCKTMDRDGRCEICALRREFLQDMLSPVAFLQQELATPGQKAPEVVIKEKSATILSMPTKRSTKKTFVAESLVKPPTKKMMMTS